MLLHHESRGAGSSAVLLLHGFLGSGRNLASFARRWSERAPDKRFYLLDLPGHGHSPPLPQDADLGSVAQDVIATARTLGLEAPWHLVGHSLGGRVALRALNDAPDMIASAVLLDIGPSPLGARPTRLDRVLDVLLVAPEEAPSRAAMRAFFVDAAIAPPLVDWLLLNLIGDTSGVVRWHIDRAALGSFHARTSREDLWPAVVAHGARVRCIRGGLSPFVSDEEAARLVSLGCAVQTIPDADHFLHVERQRQVLDAIVAPSPV